jgi:formylglycine-generating enzyme required for sulfatase activity
MLHDDLVCVPAGPFVMGSSEEEVERLAGVYGWHSSWFDGEQPARRVELDAFLIDRVPVTNRRYERFVAATGYEPPPAWNGGSPPDALLDHPVVTVNRADASAYAAWAGMRLPSEAEWEKAARGEDGRLYPWGDALDETACCWNQPSTSPVGRFPGGSSPYGVWDVAGNVYEWCADGPAAAIGYLKGGCFMTSHPLNLRPAARMMCGLDGEGRWLFTGFRCAGSAA